MVVLASVGALAAGAWALRRRPAPPASVPPVPRWSAASIARLQASARQASANERVTAARDLGPRLVQAARQVQVEEGLTTRQVHDRVARALHREGLVPSLRGHNGFPAHVAVSAEPGVVHGLPGPTALLSGQLVTLECAVVARQGHAALTWTLPVGPVDPLRTRLRRSAEAALHAALSLVSPAARTGDLGAAISRRLRMDGFAPVLDYSGYTMGPRRISAPAVSPTLGRGSGARLQPGQLLFVLALARRASARLTVADDGWTARTLDHSPTAAASAMVLVTEDGGLRLTPPLRASHGASTSR